MKNSVHIIFNPTAGAGRAARLKGWLTAQLDARYAGGYAWMETSRQGEATQLAATAIENGARLLIAVGGDGTINEVVNGFFKNGHLLQPACVLGILNCGSGGGFAQSLGLPAGIPGQLDLIEKAAAKPVDIGHAIYTGEDGNTHERYFVNEFQTGIGADIVSKVGFKHKHFGGVVAFGSATVSEMLRTGAARMKSRLDGHEPQTNDLLGIVIGNGQYCAGGMQLTPGANHFDGLLDVLFIRKMTLLQRCLDFPKIYAGKHIFSKNFSLEQAGTIDIDSTPPVRVEADGELLGMTPCKIKVIPGAIRVNFKKNTAMTTSKSLQEKLLRIEFEARIFISLGIVAVICLINFVGFPQLPGNMELVGRMFGWTKEFSVTAGFLFVAFLMVAATLLRMWSGTVLSSSLVMSFKIQKDVLSREGPYLLSRNPIYLADLLAMCGFAFCLSPIGWAMPVLLFFHYSRLIEYEEISLESQFGTEFQEFKKQTPRFLPNLQSLRRLGTALADFRINYDGFRHDALYLLFIPGFIVSAFTGKLLFAILIGLPAVIDWAIVHTKIGLDPEGAAKKKAEPAAKLKQSKVFEDIIYAQCWEDPEMDRTAFNTGPEDVVFSVTSGGCNTLAFLADNPKKVIALDLSPYQNFLLELKMAAFRALSYEELLAFLGVTDSRERLKMYDRLRPHLTPESRKYWDGQPKKIRMGVIHSGRYEKYMRLLKKGLTLLVGKSLPQELFACQTQAERKQLYDQKWDNFRWRFFTKIFLSRRMMTLLFTGKFFEQLDSDFSFGDHFRSKIKRAVTQLPLKENYFLAYTLLGRFYSPEHLPVYLRREYFEKIKSRLGRIEIVTGPCETYFQSLPPNSISKFNFTNIFEWMEPKVFENLLRETIRVARNGAVMTYRNLLVPRSRPASLACWIEPQTTLADQLLDADRSFIYRAYHVEKVVKTEKTPLRTERKPENQVIETAF